MNRADHVGDGAPCFGFGSCEETLRGDSEQIGGCVGRQGSPTDVGLALRNSLPGVCNEIATDGCWKAIESLIGGVALKYRRKICSENQRTASKRHDPVGTLVRLLTGGLLVRVQPEEPAFARLRRASARRLFEPPALRASIKRRLSRRSGVAAEADLLASSHKKFPL